MATAPKRGIKVVKMGYKMEMGRRNAEMGMRNKRIGRTGEGRSEDGEGLIKMNIEPQTSNIERRMGKDEETTEEALFNYWSYR